MKIGLTSGLIWPQRQLQKKDGIILDSWTIYGRHDFKDLYGHVKIVNDKQELQDIAQS